jgi:DHA3 family macrolide efflux protein-like MFS transporter
MLTSLLGLLMIAAGMIGLGFTSVNIFYSSVIACVLLGVGVTFSNAPLMAIMNLIIAKEMQGWVFALYESLTTAVLPLGLAISGPVADALDIRLIYWITDGIWLVIIPLALLNKSLMNLENEKPEEEPAAEVHYVPLTAEP